MKISGVIFDLDGTVIDSRELWTKAFLEVLKTLGKNITGEDPVAHGVPIEGNWRVLLPRYGVKTGKTIEELKDLTYKYYVKFLPEARLMDGAVDFMEGLKDSGVKIALATNCEWWVVEKIFSNLGLNDFFDATVTEEETPSKKPAPDALMIAADKLGLPTGDCIAVGDTKADIGAARGAGMKVIIIAPSEKEKLKLHKADLLVDHFSEITPEAIDQL